MGCVPYSVKATLAEAEAEQRGAQIAYLDRVARVDLVFCGEVRLCADFKKEGGAL